MEPKDAILIKDAVAPYYPPNLHRGIILGEAPYDNIFSSRRWWILWSDGSTGVYHVSIIMMGWNKI